MALTVPINETTAIDGRCHQCRSRCRRQFSSEARRVRLTNVNVIVIAIAISIANVIAIESPLQFINVNGGCQSLMH